MRNSIVANEFFTQALRELFHTGFTTSFLRIVLGLYVSPLTLLKYHCSTSNAKPIH